MKYKRIKTNLAKTLTDIDAKKQCEMIMQNVFLLIHRY